MYKPIVVEKVFLVTKEALWNAITNKDQMIKWFFENIPAFKAEVGFKTKFLIENESRQFTHLWEILKVIPNKKIVYNWKYKEYPGEGIVHFDVEEESKQTKLTITNLGLETFPQDIPEFKRESCEGGWNYFINRLDSYLNS